MCERHRLSAVVRTVFAVAAEPAPQMPDMTHATSSPTASTRRRRRLWELEEKHHCQVVGSCLSLKDLQKLARQAGFQGQGFDPYRLHVEAVSLAGSRNPVSERMQAMLERKHALWVRRYATLTTDTEVLDLWREHLPQGEVAGAMWAALTHPAASADTRARIYADVHMLSHQLGAGQAVTLRRLARLEQDHAQATHRLGELSRQHAEAMGVARARQKTLEDECQRLRAELKRLEPVQARLAMLESGQVMVEMGRRLLLLEAANGDLRAQVARLKALEEERQALKAELERLTEERDAIAAERDALERLFMSHGQTPTGCEGDCARCPDGLRGRCVLCVGGRTSLLTHYRRLAASFGVRLIHHDGGREDALSRLPELLAAADAVICPTDSISHAAYGQLKRHCKNACKPCVLARTSGIAGFAAALARLAEGRADQRNQILHLDS